LGLQTVLLDDPARPDTAHQLVLGEDSTAGIDERDEHIECAPPELDWLTVCQQLAAMRKHLKTAELDRRRLGFGIHCRRF
jgi:hypothetical protein